MTVAYRQWVYTMMKVSDCEALVRSVVTSLSVGHDLGYLQSPPIQINPHDALELGGLSRIVESITFRKATLEASPFLVPLRIACT